MSRRDELFVVTAITPSPARTDHPTALIGRRPRWVQTGLTGNAQRRADSMSTTISLDEVNKELRNTSSSVADSMKQTYEDVGGAIQAGTASVSAALAESVKSTGAHVDRGRKQVGAVKDSATDTLSGVAEEISLRAANALAASKGERVRSGHTRWWVIAGIAAVAAIGVAVVLFRPRPQDNDAEFGIDGPA
jgi:hypothetical protein